jgi:hypothetical protein
MHFASFILATALVVTIPSMAGSKQGNLPGVGAFTYNGSPIVSPAPVVMAAN